MWPRSGDELPPAKRISTPAGLRLSVIMNDVRAGPSSPSSPSTPMSPLPPKRTSRAPRLSIIKGTTIVVTPPEDEEQPVELEKSTHTSSPGHSSCIFSEKSAFEEEQAAETQNEQNRRRNKKISWALGVLVILLLALVIGLAVGLSRKDSKSKTAYKSSTPAGETSNPSSTSVPTTVAVPKNFPLGSYSMVTFLDTILTNCTANPATWTCAPYTIFNDDHTKAMATFNWEITAGPTAGSYQISSTDNTFGIQFQNAPLSLISQGQSSERYQFQVMVNKVVNPSLNGSTATCYFNSTTFQGYLYTKMAKDYPMAGQPAPNTGHPVWPFAARAEQVIGGGDASPICYETSTNGQLGARITDGLAAQAGGALCSCLYKNWQTPISGT